ncbi:MAG: hypothetical protein ABI882_10360, partial [Acidobacteriota bacterium]
VGDEMQTRPDPPRPVGRLKHLGRNWRVALWWRPGVIVAASAMILITLFVILRSPLPAVSAAEILRRSVAAEKAGASGTDTIVHRSLNLSVRDPRGGRLHLQQRIEIWQSPTIKVRRLYDDTNLLVAGEWRKTYGSSTLYRTGAEPQQTEQTPSTAPSQLTVDNAWLREPSAEDFARLASDAAQVTLHEEAIAFRVTLQGALQPSGDHGSQISEATIILSRPAMRPVEQVFIVGSADGIREFRFAETRFEQRKANEVAAIVFEPDAVFFPVKETDLVAVVPETPVPAPSLAPVPVVATAELEIEVLSLLSAVGATLGEEVSVARSLDGSLQVTGVVEGNERKSSILSALEPIAGHPVIKVQVETTEEAMLRIEKARTPSEAAVVQIEEKAPPIGIIAVDAELRRYLLAKGTSTDKLDEEINQFANHALRSSRQAVLYAWSLRRMVQRFSASELQSLDHEARVKWLTMISEHTIGYEREIAGLRAHLSLAFAARAAADETATEIVDEAGLARIILRMAELSTNTDETIRSAFTLSGGDASAVSSTQFWRTISNAEFLAHRIAQSVQQLKASSSRIPR